MQHLPLQWRKGVTDNDWRHRNITEEKKRRAVSNNIDRCLYRFKTGTEWGRVGPCVERYREPQKVLPKSFYLRLPKIAPFAIKTAWRYGERGNFRAPSKLFYNILAPEKQAKKLNLQENSAPQKRKAHIISRIHPLKPAFYAEVNELTHHRPTPKT